MAKIRKIYDQTIKPNGVKTTIYPITSTRAVYTTDGNTLDNYLKTKNIYGTSLDGYKEVNSIDDLPDTPSEDGKKYGYIIGTKLYIYVGEGGTIKGGKYADCGTFEGASAYDITVDNGFEGTEQEWLDSLHAPLAHVTRSDVINALSYTPVSPQELNTKVDKDGTKVLSDNNFTNAYKDKIDNVDSAVSAAEESAETAERVMVRLEELLEEASVDQSVIDVAKMSEHLAKTDVQVETNTNQIFGATQNYIKDYYVLGGDAAQGKAFAKTGWNVSYFVDISDVWLESNNSVSWYYGADRSVYEVSVCLYDENQEYLAYHSNTEASGHREWTWTAPAAKYIRIPYYATYTEAKLIINGELVWKPKDTVSGLVPYMESSSEDIETIKEETIPAQTTTVTQSEANAANKSMEDWVLHRWHQKTSVTFAAMAANTNIRNRFRSTNNGSLNRDLNRVLLEPCIPGDRFIVSGPATNYTNCFLWAFFDANWNPISTAKDKTAYTNHMITAPSNSAYIVINWYHNDEEPVATTKKFFKITYGSLRSMVLDLQDSVGSYGKGDILTFNPDKDIRPELLASRRANTPVTIAHFSDVHGTDGTQVSRFIEFCDYFSSFIDVKLNTGDTVNGNFGDIPATQTNWWYRRLDGVEHIFNVIGNHDVASYSSGVFDWTAHVGDDAYYTYIEPFISNWEVSLGGENKCYYYKDFESQSIRLIMLDMPGYDSTEDSWFETILADALTRSYTVVVASHFVGAVIEALPSRFTSLAHAKTGSTHSAYMVDSTLFAAAAKKVDDFIENGGTFACWLVGHSHYDFLSTVSATQPNDITIAHSQLVVVVDTASNNSSQYSFSDISHNTGTKLQDCFNIVTIDPTSQLLKIVRIGCTTDRWMRDKNSLCINYITKEIIE